MEKKYKNIVLFACLLAAVVVTLGAYTRLSNAGLGCPDWPGCYGFLTVPNEHHEISAAQSAFPEAEIEPKKAWIEMVHRYFAGTLGLVILAIALLAVRRAATRPIPVKLSLFILVLVVFQAMLGMWTVTMNLQPFVVMGHLLGGFSILALLTLLVLRLNQRLVFTDEPAVRTLYPLTLGALGVLIVQIALGGWLAANYAAPHCVGLPLCQNIELFSLESLFHLPVGASNYEYGVLPFETRLSIHLVHRIWAMVTLAVLGFAAFKVYMSAIGTQLKGAAKLVLFLLIAQVVVGGAIVHWQFPLHLTLFHNFMAAMLLISTVRLVYLVRAKA
ncbi:Heme A synthase, cytochrome oxidase biogenesis protein Cox15-CtaA [Pseudoalteromonas luteoviolacea B = ATCC 29581]|nr:Heme A synthase, cytochrome oxidase biogenesis protein Cox15-CtaA [Pseudoalteromonas luteoviolacea B = ATCC 29581]